MSKSLSNTVTINDFLKIYTSDQFRYFCLLSPYRNGKFNLTIIIYLIILLFFDQKR